MGRYNYKGDIESVAPQQLDFISNALEKKGFKGPDVTIEVVGTAADNYVANVKRVIIKENGTIFKMIAKLAPDNAMMREMGNLEMSFHNEHVIYTEVLPKLRELQRSAGIPKEDWFRSAECYGSTTEVPEVILLEDLNEDNYFMLDRFKPLSYGSVKVALKNLATYHSLSYVLKHKEPEIFNTLVSKLHDIFSENLASRDDFILMVQQIKNSALAALQEDRYKKLVNGSLSGLFQHAKSVIKADTRSKSSVILQGDGWTNNILFKIEGETTVNCALIDYQAAKEGNPVFDIMYMLFNSTNHEQRQKHYHEFIDYYHSELDKSLHNYGLKASLVLPRDQLDADLKRYAKFMLGASVLISSFVIRKTEDASKFKEDLKNSGGNMEQATKAALTVDQETISLFKNKLEGLVDSFLEFGLLQNA